MVGCGSKSANIATQQKSVTSTPAQPAAPATVVFIGDSITYLWSQPGFGQAEWSQHAEWNDQGIIGQTLSVVDRFQQDVVSQHPAVVHILTGTNDTYSTNSPAWQVDGGSVVFDTTDNIKAMVVMAQAAGIKVTIWHDSAVGSRWTSGQSRSVS